MPDNLHAAHATHTLDTKRLHLRPVDPQQDFPAWAEAMADAQTMHYIGGTPLSEAEAWRAMATVIGHWQIRGYGFFSVIEAASGQWVGRIGPWYPLGWTAPEIGWMIHPAHVRKGYASEAALACVDYAYDVLGWDNIIHVIGKQNIASQKTAQRIGSSRSGEIDRIEGVPNSGPCWIYTHTRQ